MNKLTNSRSTRRNIEPRSLLWVERSLETLIVFFICTAYALEIAEPLFGGTLV
jgi:hypothetical protein